MNLTEIRDMYQDKVFALSYYNAEAHGSKTMAHIIHPKEVKIKEDLTVWDAKKGNCIINGMKGANNFVVASTLKELESIIKKDYPKDVLALRVKKKKL